MRKTLSIFLLLLLASMLTLTMVPTAKATRHAPITVDGDPSDWTGTPPATDNTWIYNDTVGEWIWRDMVGDDKGNGTYTYPTANETTPGPGPPSWDGCTDLTELRIAWNESYVFFLLTFDNITNIDEWAPDAGWLSDPVQSDTNAMAICIDIDRADGSGMDLVDDGLDGISADVYLPDEALWEYVIEIALADVVLWYWDGAFIAEAVRMFPIAANVNVTETVEFAVPIDEDPYYGLPDPEGETWRFFAFIGLQDYEHFREVVGGPAQIWLGGGGADHEFDPDVYDSAFFATQADQEAALNGFTDSDYATMPFGAPLGPSWRAIPEFPLPFGFVLIAIVVLAVSFKLRKKLYP